MVKDDEEIIQWEQVDMKKHAAGNLGIGDGKLTLDSSGTTAGSCTPPNWYQPSDPSGRWDASAPLVVGREVMQFRDDGLYIAPRQESSVFEFKQPGAMWARIDKDLNVTHLDMDLCTKGPQNEYTALALAIWNAALEEAVKYAVGDGDDVLADSIRELKK